jgi:hypothetical protein
MLKKRKMQALRNRLKSFPLQFSCPHLLREQSCEFSEQRQNSNPSVRHETERERERERKRERNRERNRDREKQRDTQTQDSILKSHTLLPFFPWKGW